MKRLIFQSRLICFKINHLSSERKLATWKLYWESCIFATDRPKNFWHSWGEWNLTLFWEVNVLLSFLSALIMGIVVKRFIKGVFLTPFFIQICIMVEKSSKLHFRARDLNRWKPMKNSLKCSSLPSTQSVMTWGEPCIFLSCWTQAAADAATGSSVQVSCTQEVLTSSFHSRVSQGVSSWWS